MLQSMASLLKIVNNFINYLFSGAWTNCVTYYCVLFHMLTCTLKSSTSSSMAELLLVRPEWKQQSNPLYENSDFHTIS